MDIIANADGFGAEIRGLDLAKPLNAQELADLRQAWFDHSVIWMPDQPLDAAQLEAFTEAWGEYGHTQFIEPMDGHPNILELRRETDEKASHFGQGWHSDYSFQTNPPAATLLLSKVTPPVGGDTLYADGRRAYEALSDEQKERLENLQGIHSAVLPYSKQGFYANEEGARSMKITPSDEAKGTHLHPIIRTHPGNGRKALWVNRVYTIGIDGVDDEESKTLLDELCAHAVRDEFIYRHKWRENMLTIWDNRCVQHYADAGFDGYRRVMWRTTTSGEVPA